MKISVIILNALIFSSAVFASQSKKINDSCIKELSYPLFSKQHIEQIQDRIQKFDNALLFSSKEYKQRLRNFRKKMKVRGVELAVVSFIENLSYLTGFHTTGYDTQTFLIIPLKDEPVIVSRLLEDTNFIARTWLRTESRWPYSDTMDPYVRLKDILKKYGYHKFKNIGLDLHNGEFITAKDKKSLKNVFKGKKIYDLGNDFRELRWEKSEEEIAAMKEAAKLTVIGMKAAINALKPGVTENEIYAVAYDAMMRAGSEPPEVRPYITSGPWSLIGHATTNNRVINKGDVVFLEFTGQHKRYIAPMMRIVYMGDKPPQALIEGSQLVTEKVLNYRSLMTPGQNLGAIYSDFDPQRLQKIGAVNFTRHGYTVGGNGFAPGWHQNPVASIKPTEKITLKVGSTMHVIPWIQFLGETDNYKHLDIALNLPEPRDYRGIIGISDTILVTSEGAESIFKGLDAPKLKLIIKPF